MSYLNHAQEPGRRATAVVTVGAVHALLAVGLVAGLTVNFERIVDTNLIGTSIPLPPPPTPDPSPPPPAPAAANPVAPVPPIPLPPPSPPIYERDDTSDYVDRVSVNPGPPAPPLPPSPPLPSFTPNAARPSNGPAGWISTNDYPRRPLVEGIEGSVGYRLVVGTNGRVSSCELTRASGNRALDDATCRLIASRARFDAATDENGAKVLGTYTGSVRWEIPD